MLSQNQASPLPVFFKCQFGLTTLSTSRSICSLCPVTICVSGCHARYTALWDLIDTKGQRHIDCCTELASRSCIFCYSIKHVLQGSSLRIVSHMTMSEDYVRDATACSSVYSFYRYTQQAFHNKHHVISIYQAQHYSFSASTHQHTS